jgi:hypothetical protein
MPMSSPALTLQKIFPRCPVCKSTESYEPSPFYPNVMCKSCQAELVLHENGLELKRASKLKWDEELLNKKYPFDFWKNLKAPEMQIVERIFAPMDYVGGNPYYRNPVIGFIRLKFDGLMYKASEGSCHNMEVKVASKKLLDLEIMKTDEIASLLGEKSLLIATSNQYLVLKYKDKANRQRQIVLDFHGQQQNADELIRLANQLKEKKPKHKKLRAKKKSPLILRNIARTRAANTRLHR